MLTILTIKSAVKAAISVATTLLIYRINNGKTMSLTVVNEAQTRSKISIPL